MHRCGYPTYTLMTENSNPTTPTIQIGYKIVHRTYSNKLVSCWQVDHPSRYGIGVVTVPLEDCGPLAVFGTLNAAEQFLIHLYGCAGQWEIYKCRYQPTNENLIDSRRALWNHGSYTSLGYLPTGTILAESVELIEKILIFQGATGRIIREDPGASYQKIASDSSDPCYQTTLHYV